MISADALTHARAVRIENEVERRGIRLRGRVNRCGPCPLCGGTDRFSINIRKQVWNCRRCKPKKIRGDVIGLVQWLNGVTFEEALQILTGERLPAQIPTEESASSSKGSDQYEREQHRKAAWLWSQSRPIDGSPAEKYLYMRGIGRPSPPTLAFLPPSKRAHHPAMIAVFGVCAEPEPAQLAVPSDVRSVHLTLLTPEGTKADVKPNKLIIGSPGGMPITLAPANDLLALAIAEGIEDALALHHALGIGAWAAGGASRCRPSALVGQNDLIA